MTTTHTTSTHPSTTKEKTMKKHLRKSPTTTTLALLGAGALITAAALTGCSSSDSTAAAPADAAASAPADAAAGAAAVLPVDKNPIVNNAADQTLQVTYAAVEDNVDPATNQPIDDNLELTLKNTGSVPLTGLEVYYEMTDVTTGAKEGYYQALDSVTIPAGQETTVFFDNGTGVGHYPDNQFSLYRTSNNEVDFAVQVSAKEAAVATATAVKSVNTGEKAD